MKSGRPRKRWQLAYGKDAQLLRLAFVFTSKIFTIESSPTAIEVKEAVRVAVKQGVLLYQNLELFRRCPDETEFELVLHSAVYSSNQFRPVQRGKDLKVIGRAYHRLENSRSGTSDRSRVRDDLKKRRKYLAGLLENELQDLFQNLERAKERRALLKSLCHLDDLEMGARFSARAMGKPDIQMAITKAVGSVRKVVLEAQMAAEPEEKIVISDPIKAFNTLWRDNPEERDELEAALKFSAFRVEASSGIILAGFSRNTNPASSARHQIPGLRRVDRLAKDAQQGVDFLALIANE